MSTLEVFHSLNWDEKPEILGLVFNLQGHMLNLFLNDHTGPSASHEPGTVRSPIHRGAGSLGEVEGQNYVPG